MVCADYVKTLFARFRSSVARFQAFHFECNDDRLCQAGREIGNYLPVAERCEYH
jgi:hypothetical protein